MVDTSKSDVGWPVGLLARRQIGFGAVKSQPINEFYTSALRGKNSPRPKKPNPALFYGRHQYIRCGFVWDKELDS
jgi:hypothetical protein